MGKRGTQQDEKERLHSNHTEITSIVHKITSRRSLSLYFAHHTEDTICTLNNAPDPKKLNEGYTIYQHILECRFFCL